MIYVFIAGSYFPWLTLEHLPNEGWSSQMKWIVWFLAVIGIIYQQIFHEKYKMLETIFYLIMGIGPICPILSEVRISFTINTIFLKLIKILIASIFLILFTFNLKYLFIYLALVFGTETTVSQRIC